MNPTHTPPRAPGRRSALALPALALAALLGGCDELPFTPPSLVDKPRIAAVAADPPVIALQGGVTTLTALIVAPDGRDSRVAPDRTIDIEVRWRACNPWKPVFDPYRDCGAGDSLPLDTADGDAWQAQGQLSAADVLAAFPPPPGTIDGDQPDDTPPGSEPDECPHSYEYAEIPVVAEVEVGDSRLVAVQRVRVTLQPLDRKAPVLGGLVLGDAMAEAGQVTRFDGGAEHDLTAWMERDSLDPVCVDGDPEQVVSEGVEVHVYVTAGELEESNVDIAYLMDGTESAETITWTAPAGGEAVIWLVAVDADGGMSWDRFDLQAR